MYMIETVGGEYVAHCGTYEQACERARRLLEDDPEIGTLEIFRVEHRATVTHGPDANWDTQVVVLAAGERLEPPAGIPPRMSDDEFEAYVRDAYGDDFAKAEGMRRMREGGYC